jgi:hypothetical protein
MGLNDRPLQVAGEDTPANRAKFLRRVLAQAAAGMRHRNCEIALTHVSAAQHVTHIPSGGSLKGTIMSDLKPAKPARIDLVGLAHVSREQPKPVKAPVDAPRADLALLDQMYGYFCD